MEKIQLRHDFVASQLLLSLVLVAATLGSTAIAVNVTTRSYDLGRTGWNPNETVLKPSNVTPSTFHKVGELRVDDKIEASPLYVGSVTTSSGVHDLLIVTTTNNTVYAFDANTNVQIWLKNLGPAVQGLKPALYDKWGITSTPVVDPDTNTLYVVRLAWEGVNKVYRLSGLRLSDGGEDIQSQAVDGFSVQRNGKVFRNGEQIIRTGLGIWRNAAGAKAVIFGAAGGEDVNGANGWVIAYNIAQLRAGGNVTPAVWCSTPKAGGAGIWMASQGLAVDESDPNRDIYFATGNGPYNPTFGADDLGESVVRLRFDPNANTLNVVDWFTPFTDASHDADHQDQDLGAGTVVLIPNAKSVLAGGKEGIFYNVDRTNMGKLSHANLLQPDFIGTFTPVLPFNYLANTNQATTTDGTTGGNGGDRTFIPHPADGGLYEALPWRSGVFREWRTTICGGDGRELDAAPVSVQRHHAHDDPDCTVEPDHGGIGKHGSAGRHAGRLSLGLVSQYIRRGRHDLVDFTKKIELARSGRERDSRFEHLTRIQCASIRRFDQRDLEQRNRCGRYRRDGIEIPAAARRERPSVYRDLQQQASDLRQHDPAPDGS